MVNRRRPRGSFFSDGVIIRTFRLSVDGESGECIGESEHTVMEGAIADAVTGNPDGSRRDIDRRTRKLDKGDVNASESTGESVVNSGESSVLTGEPSN